MLNPPRERPKAWSSGRPPGPFFSGPRGRFVGPHHAAVDAEQLPVDLAVGLPLGLQLIENLVPESVLAPEPEPLVDGLPRAETLRQISPGGSGGHHPEDAVDHQPMILPLAAAPAVGRKEMSNSLPLLIA